MTKKALTEAQIQRAANMKEWKFRCPECNRPCYGTLAGDTTRFFEALKKGKKYPFVNHVKCVWCGWEWFSKEYYRVVIVQTALEDF